MRRIMWGFILNTAYPVAVCLLADLLDLYYLGDITM